MCSRILSWKCSSRTSQDYFLKKIDSSVSPFFFTQSAKMEFFPGLQVTQTATGYSVSGMTFNYKEQIKTIPGARWNAAEKAWTLPNDANLTLLQRPVPRREPYTPNMWAFDRLRDTRRRECCSNCKREFDRTNPQGPMWFVCPTHGRWQSDYTGD